MIGRVASFCAVTLALAACSRIGEYGALPTRNFDPGTTTTPGAATFKTIFTFNGTDGAVPSGGLIALQGALLGTTADGGKYNRGTVFSLTPDGTEKVIHDFNHDGRYPGGSLLALDGTLYGAMGYGASRSGGIFAMRTDGKLLWTYDFKGRWDGAAPKGGLTDLQGTLYGVTGAGGNYYKNAGAFFKVTRAGKETLLRAFSGGPDGGDPNGNLVALNGALYGTTMLGGAPYGNSNGVVVRLTKQGDETEIYHFGKTNNDATWPTAGLTYYNGTFYGTTEAGGKYDLGTVFSITPNGKERVLHSFGSSKDGSFPQCLLAIYKGKIYGTTMDGGLHGYGTIFELTTSGEETVLYNFSNGSDGAEPVNGLTVLNGVLYGTTTKGPYTSTYGTAFALKI